MSFLYRREDEPMPSFPSPDGPKASITRGKPPTINVSRMLRMRVVLVSSPEKPVTNVPIWTLPLPVVMADPAPLTHGRVVSAGTVSERTITDRRVEAARGVVNERSKTDGRV